MEKLRENYRNLERFYAEDMNKMTHIINSLSDNAQVFISPTNDEKIVGEIDTDIKVGDIVIDDGSVNPDQKGFIYKVEDIYEQELSEWFKSDFDAIKPEDDVVVCVYHKNGEKYALLTSGVSKDEPAVSVTVEDVEGTDAITDGVTEDTIVNIKPSELLENAFVFYRKKEGEETAWLATKNTANGVAFFSDPNAEGAQNKNIQIEYHPESAITCIFTICDDDKKRYFWTNGSIFKTKDGETPNSDVRKCDFNFFVKKSKIVTIVTLSTLNDGSGGGSSEGHVYNEEKHSLAEGRYTIAEGYDSHAEGYGIWCKVKILSYESNSVKVKLLDHTVGEWERDTIKKQKSIKLLEEYQACERLGYQIIVPVEPNNEITSVNFEYYTAIEMTITFNDDLHGEDNWWQKEYVELIMENKATNNGSHSEGKGTFALGRNTHTEGLVTQATNDNAHAEGHLTIAKGINSHAEGLRTNAAGENTHAEGYSDGDTNTEITVQSINFNNRTMVVDHLYYHPKHIGDSSFYLQPGIVIEYQGRELTISNVDEGKREITVIGNLDGISSGSYIKVLGGRASGKFSHVEGRTTFALAEASHAEGKNTVASGEHSHSEGQGTIANGHVSHAEGIHTLATGKYSHAEGEETKVISQSSHAEGKGTITGFKLPTYTIGKFYNASYYDRWGNYYNYYTTDTNNYFTSIYSDRNLSEYVGRFVRNEISGGLHYYYTTDSLQSGKEYYFNNITNVAENGKTAFNHAEGFKTIALGKACHTEGFKTEASGRYNHVEGYGCYEIIGNDIDTNNNFALNTQDPDFVVITNMDSEGWIYVNTLYNDDKPFIKENDIVSIDSNDERIIPCCVYSIEKGNRRFKVYSEHPNIHNWSYLSDLITFGKTKLRKYHGITIGSYNHIEGFGCESSGKYNHIEGYECKDNQVRYSHIEGFRTEVSGNYSHVEGYETKAYHYGHAEGYSTEASGYYSHAEGGYTRALGGHSHAEGFSTESSGSYSHAEGFSTESSGYYSHAEGEKTVANGVASHSEGGNQEKKKCYIEKGVWTINDRAYYYRTDSYVYPRLSIFEKPISTSELGKIYDVNVYHLENYYYFDCSGVGNSGTYYLSNGTYGSHASGIYSHAEGSNTETNNISEHAEGQFNMSHSEDSETHGLSANTQHSIGIGYYDYDNEEEHRKNAFEVMQNGDAYLYGVGGYDGTNPDSATRLQDLFGGGSAEGHIYNVEKDSLAEGTKEIWQENLNTASGIRSHAEGFLTEASGYYAHAEGRRTQAKNGADGEHAEGSLNISHRNTISSIGCGDTDNGVEVRCNAFEVLSEGGIYIKGIGGYTGQNDPNSSDVKSLQAYISSLEERIRQLENNQ